VSPLKRAAVRLAASLGVAGQVWLLATVAALCWLPFMGLSPSRDEAGLLMVGRQWGPGSSLYGNYWVDRPPLLIALFEGASVVGGAPAARLMGALAAVASVVAAAALGRAIAPDAAGAPVAVAATTAVATGTTLMGAGAANAEALAVPFVLAGCWAMVRALSRRSTGSAVRFAMLSGVFGVSAVMVKQNFLEVFVFAAAALVVHARQANAGRRRLLALSGAVASGSLLTCVLVLGTAALLGSDPLDMWDALVVFRGEASVVIATSATADTAHRFAILVAAIVATALPMVIVSVLPTLVGPTRSATPPGSALNGTGEPAPLVTDLRLPAVVVLTWEIVGVLVGGSYWLHYLLALVPGIALLVAVAFQRRPSAGRGFKASIALASISTIVTVAANVIHPEAVPEQASIDYLRAHAAPGDTGVVAFGAPNILYAAGLDSPYQHLWSLPVRVRDPGLHGLAAVLAGTERPDWLLVTGSSVATWGVDEDAARPLVERYYVFRAVADDFRIYSLITPTP
jgi:hypothetical protein